MKEGKLKKTKYKSTSESPNQKRTETAYNPTTYTKYKVSNHSGSNSARNLD